jgi:stage II sporulation protein P
MTEESAGACGDGGRDRVRRIATGTAAAYLGALLLLLAAASYGVPPTVPVAAIPSPQAAPLPRALYRRILASGMPVLGLVSPPPPLASALPAARLFASALEVLTAVRVGDPASIVGEVLPGVLTAPPRPGAVGAYPALLLAGGYGERSQVGGDVVLGRPPVVALYETNTRDSFWPLVRLSGRGGTTPVSDDPRENMVAVATMLGEALWREGVPTVVSRQVNDAAGMLGAYVRSKAVAAGLLRRYPSVSVLLDVDRYDRPLGTVRGAARVALVVGTGARLPDPHWRRNLAFARTLGEELQRVAPGLLAGIHTSPDRLNQDLFPNALTVAIGGPDNTLSEEERACRALARAIGLLLSSGSLPPP